MTDTRTRIAGEDVVLMPERAMLWPVGATLFVADLHFGKMATLRAAGAPVPGGSTSADLQRLSDALRRAAARHLVVLGDWAHARAGHTAPRTHEALIQWRRRHPDLRITLVRGNHDLHAGDPALEMDVAVVLEGQRLGPFELHHQPPPDPATFALAGHLHPGVVLRGAAGARVRLPCFWIRPDQCILPAFGSTTGLQVVRPGAGDEFFVVAGNEVLAV